MDKKDTPWTRKILHGEEKRRGRGEGVERQREINKKIRVCGRGV